MAESDSSLSSAPPTDDELEASILQPPSKKTGLHKYFKATTEPRPPTPEPPKREPSPPHEYVLADNDAIAFLVMFRSRFSDAFPRSLPHYGPQDIERGVSQAERVGDEVERLLCALLGICLNRKKDVERGHYGRALEDAVSSFQNQWPLEWKGVNPLHGGRNFNNMTPEERLVLLKALVLWSLNASEAVQTIIKESWKQTRRDDDKNQPRSVQPWLSDSYRRRYWLVEGQEDSFFRVYRENDAKTKKGNQWFSVAGSIEEVNALADKFVEEGTHNAKINADKLRMAVPRFEQGEEKRKRKQYRQERKAMFTRPEPGFGQYEGRTRGKRMRYNYDDGEDSGDESTTRSTRHGTPDDGPTITASGRQVKPRQHGVYGQSLHADQRQDLDSLGGEEESDDMPTTLPMGRSKRAATTARVASRTREVYRDDVESDGDEAQSSGKDWSGDENEPDVDSEPEFDGNEEEEDDEMSDEGLEADEIGAENGDTQESLIVQLRYRKGKSPATDGQTPGQSLPNGAVNGLSRPVTSIQEAMRDDTIEVALPAQPIANELRKEAPIVNAVHNAQLVIGGVNGVKAGMGMQNGVAHYPEPQLQPMDVS